MGIFEPFDEQQFEREAAETDALLARAQRQRSFNDRLVYKKTHRPVEQQLPHHQAPMSAEAAAAWDRWADARVLSVHDEILRVAIAEFVVAYTQKHLAKIREEIASLRADLTIARALMKGEISEIVRKDGERDAA